MRVALERLRLRHEILVVIPETDSVAADFAGVEGVRMIAQAARGYAAALSTGFAAARGTYILTLDPDVGRPAALIEALWSERHQADVVIASRYSEGRSEGRGHVGAWNRLLNAIFAIGLDVPITDFSSRYRLYRASVIRNQRLTASGFDALPQTVVEAYAEGWRVREIPFATEPSRNRGSGEGSFSIAAHVRQFGRLWLLRNSILAADYDERAYDSRIFLQRYWQRSRYRHVMDLIAGAGKVLDVGCGSSRIIQSLPAGSVGVDILLRKLRYGRKFGKPLVQGSGFALPFADSSFPCVLCSQVIEHVPKESPILDELCRVLRPGGRLVLGTPDYANWQWVWIERLYGLVPGGYADEHISHYTRDELIRIMHARNFRFDRERYILRGELILSFTKPL